MVESAIDAAPFIFGDLTSMAPLLILSASCECVGDAPLSATPPSISVSDILSCVVWSCKMFLSSRFDYFLAKSSGWDS
jgi:hypothetical protein